MIPTHALVDKLQATQKLSAEEYVCLVKNADAALLSYAAEKADQVRRNHYSNRIFIRGLIEISNHCRNNCLYCGIRHDNKNAIRFRMTAQEILECCKKGHALGFRTFVLQGGEDPFYTDEVLCGIIGSIKSLHPDCAVTLSLGERSKESYVALKKAGADRYLLRHETATKDHYEKLHPVNMSFDNRMECLKNLRSCGYQVGAGFMIGSPFQTPEDIAMDLNFIQDFKPEMCGLGPFIPHKDTEFKNLNPGTVEQTLLCLSLVRLAYPGILLPATTALATISQDGISRGIKAGANVVMLNLTPKEARANYSLYDNKAAQDADELGLLKSQMKQIGYHITVDRGDCCL